MINNSTIKQFNNFDNNGDGYTVTGTNYRKRVKARSISFGHTINSRSRSVGGSKIGSSRALRTCTIFLTRFLLTFHRL